MEKENEKSREVLRLSNEESNRITRECLQSALIHLMGKKDFERITVSELVQRVGKADGSGGLTLAGGGGADGGNENQLGLAGQVLQGVDVDLGLVVAVVLELLGLDAHLSSNFLDGEHLGRLGDFNVGHGNYLLIFLSI